MMRSTALLDSIQAIIQEDVGARGLRADPIENLVNSCPHDFQDAARSLTAMDEGTLGILTGFYIPYAKPPCGETDGPLGAVFLARALIPLGYRIVIYTDGFCVNALNAGLKVGGLTANVRVAELPSTFTLADARERIVTDGLTQLRNAYPKSEFFRSTDRGATWPGPD